MKDNLRYTVARMNICLIIVPEYKSGENWGKTKLEEKMAENFLIQKYDKIVRKHNISKWTLIFLKSTIGCSIPIFHKKKKAILKVGRDKILMHLPKK